MEIASKIENGIKIIQISGQLDSACVGEFREKIASEVEKDSKVLFDCRDLSYLDSSGLATFLNLHKSLAAREASMVLCGLPEGILRVIRFTKLDKVLHIKETLEEAIQEVSTP